MIENVQNKKQNRTDSLLVLLLLIISGNPGFVRQSWTAGADVIIAGILLLKYWKFIQKEFLNKLIILLYLYLFVFFVQYFTLGYISFVFVLGFFIKIFIGAIIFELVGDRLPVVLFEVLVKLSLLSFPFYIVHIILGDAAFPLIFLGRQTESVGVYTFRPQAPGESYLRNSGMFWEPGAFQAFINISFFLSFRRIPVMLREKKWGLLILFVALLTTQSTTGYLIFAFLVLTYIVMYSSINKAFASVVVIGLMWLSVFLFYNLDFLGEKIDYQYELANDVGGEYDPTRLGALYFDLHYIYKHPFTGNGFHPITRYADHPELRAMEERGEQLGHGNGFSGFIVNAGIIGMLIYLLTIAAFERIESKKDIFLFCLLMALLLQGEHLLDFPFFLGICFLTLKAVDVRKNSDNYYLSQ